MPLKLSLGASRKVGQPGFGSMEAGCGLEVELESGLLRDDPDEFDARVRSAYVACARAVDAELSRLCAPAPDVPHDDEPDSNITRRTPARPATPRQLRALGAIARSRGRQPAHPLAEHGLDAGSVSSVEASRLISGLRATPAE